MNFDHSFSCSLLRPLPDSRKIITLNTGYLRNWWSHPFVVTHDTTEGIHEQLYYNDVKKTFALTHFGLWSHENRNRWNEIGRHERREWLRFIKRNKVLDSIVEGRPVYKAS